LKQSASLIKIFAVPALILAAAALYGFHVMDAPSVSKRVPIALLVFLVFMLVIVVAGELRGRAGEQSAATTGEESSTGPVVGRAGIAFFLLGILYFIGFGWLGFSVSNFLFIAACMLVIRVSQEGVWVPYVPSAITLALVCSALFYGMAKVMGFNLPPALLNF
jgi:hypothetical protein